MYSVHGMEYTSNPNAYCTGMKYWFNHATQAKNLKSGLMPKTNSRHVCDDIIMRS